MADWHVRGSTVAERLMKIAMAWACSRLTAALYAAAHRLHKYFIVVIRTGIDCDLIGQYGSGDVLKALGDIASSMLDMKRSAKRNAGASF